MWNSVTANDSVPTADEAAEGRGPAHVDSWAPSTYTAEGSRASAGGGVRGDLHILLRRRTEHAVLAIMCSTKQNKTAEFDTVWTHPDYRRLGLGRASFCTGCNQARAAGLLIWTVACLGRRGSRRRAAVLQRRFRGSRGTLRSSKPRPRAEGRSVRRSPASPSHPLTARARHELCDRALIMPLYGGTPPWTQACRRDRPPACAGAAQQRLPCRFPGVRLGVGACSVRTGSFR